MKTDLEPLLLLTNHMTENSADVFALLKGRRQEEEFCLDFLDRNRTVLHTQCELDTDQHFNDHLGKYLYKRLCRPATSEQELKRKFKNSYSHKEQFRNNRTARNHEYVLQRKHDFAISQQRVQALTQKLHDEYNAMVSEHLRRRDNWRSRSSDRTSSLISDMSQLTSTRVCEAAVQLSIISDALSFIPSFYSNVVKHFHAANIPFVSNSELIPDFCVQNYCQPLRKETRRLLTTLCEGCRENSMIPAVHGRKARSACILQKPLIINEEGCRQLANALGWKAVFAHEIGDSIDSLFTILSESTEDVLMFGFPRHPQELELLYQKFNPTFTNEGFLPRPIPSIVEPFDTLIEFDISDETVLRDVLAALEDPETGNNYDVRELFLDTEIQLVRLHPVKDPFFDIEQYAVRSVTLENNFKIIGEAKKDLYHKIKLESRLPTGEVIEALRDQLDNIADPETPAYPSDSSYQSLLQSVQPLSFDLKTFFMQQWETIEAQYRESIQRAFEFLHQTHQQTVAHLERSRREMQLFLARPGTSQVHVIEFQQWHCTQIERCMRRIQRVKDECYIRLTSLREQLMQIEVDRKTEEEGKQKDLTNATFRSVLFELVNNACTLMAQAEMDRWTSTRVLLIDFNQIVSDVELVPPIPHKKLTLLVDPTRNQKGKQKKTESWNTNKSESW
jgi:hypothetical protein